MEIPWHLFVMAALYILAGLNHFRKPNIYKRIIPPFVPYPKTVNIVVGIAELLLGIGLLINDFTSYFAWGIIALLIIVFPSNIFMLTAEKARLGVPAWLLILRLPIQIVLIIWAYYYT